MTQLSAHRPATPAVRPTAWLVVAGQELRDLWWSGRALTMMLAHTLLLSLTVVLVATNQELNFLEQRDAVSLTLKVAVIVGSVLVVVAAADTVSGERERGTLESLLLTPAPRAAIVIGKGVAPFSLWIAAYLLALPYIWWIGRDVGHFAAAATAGLITGTLLALFMTGLGLVISLFTQSNRLSLSLSLFVLLALVAPSQLPAEATRGWLGEMVYRADPFAAGLLYLQRVTVNAHSVGQDLGLLLGPLVAGIVATLLAAVLARRLALVPGSQS